MEEEGEGSRPRLQTGACPPEKLGLGLMRFLVGLTEDLGAVVPIADKPRLPQGKGRGASLLEEAKLVPTLPKAGAAKAELGPRGL